MSNFIVAAQLFTLRDFIQNENDMRETFRRLKDMGYNAVQMSGIGNIDKEKARYVKEISEEFNMKICVTHISFDQLKEETDWLIEVHKMWNCDYVGIGSMGKHENTLDSIKEFAETMNKYGEILSKHDLKFVYHNHRFEFEKINGKTIMEILYESFDPRYVQFEIDTFWIQSGGANPVKWIRKMKDRMGIIHFKDMGIVDNEQVMTEIGEGNLDWDEIIKACDEIGVEYAPIERDSGLTEPFESLRISLTNLKKMGCKF